MMQDTLPSLVPDLHAFDLHFQSLHASCSTEELSPELAAALANAEIRPFSASEVSSALCKMQRNKSAGLANYKIDILRDCKQELYELVAELFTTFAQHGYPRRLNTLLLMPLWKQKGAK